jgi:hypothetical protein
LDMRKGFFGILVCSAVAASVSVAAADPGSKFGGKGQGFTNDYGNHYVSTHNPDLRKDWDTGRKAIPGRAAQAQADNPTSNDSTHNVISRPGSTLVDPHHTYHSPGAH